MQPYCNNMIPHTMHESKRIEEYMRERRKHGGATWKADPELHDTIRRQVEEDHPIHTLARSALTNQRYHEALGGSLADRFAKQLDVLGLSPNDYLTQARMMARHHGYRSDLLTFAKDGTHKLRYESPQGDKYFGKAGAGDYIIYQYMEREGKVEKGYASEKRKTFGDVQDTMSERRKLDRYSPLELETSILW